MSLITPVDEADTACQMCNKNSASYAAHCVYCICNAYEILFSYRAVCGFYDGYITPQYSTIHVSVLHTCYTSLQHLQH